MAFLTVGADSVSFKRYRNLRRLPGELHESIDLSFADLDAVDALIVEMDTIEADTCECEPEDDFCLASDDTMGRPFVQDWHRAHDDDAAGRKKLAYGVDQTQPLPHTPWRRDWPGNYNCPMKLRAKAERRARERSA